MLRYKVHVQNIGWLDFVSEGAIAGTTGQNLRIEAIIIESDLPITYRVHVRDFGWLEWKKPGEITGTTGEGRQIEAMQIKGAEVWYQLHLKNYGWFAWAQEGETSGTTGERIRAEAIRITTTAPPMVDPVANGLKQQGLRIGDTRANLYIQSRSNNKVFRCDALDGVTLKREPNKPSVLSCTVTRGLSEGVDIAVGDVIAFNINGCHNQFYGYIFSRSIHGRYCDIVAYDQIIYMQKNKDTLTYEGISASTLLYRLIDDYRLKTLVPATIMDTGYVIPKRIEDNVSILDMLTTALDLTYQNTGRRFYIWDDFGAISLCSEEWFACVTNRVSMGFIQDYAYKEDMEELYNRIKLCREDSDGGRQYFTAEDAGAMTTYGYLQYFDRLEEGENGDAKAVQLLSEKSGLNRGFTVSGAQGDIRVRGGTPIYVDFFGVDHAEYIRGWFRVNSVMHHFLGGLHTMDLDLTCIGMDNDWERTEWA